MVTRPVLRVRSKQSECSRVHMLALVVANIYVQSNTRLLLPPCK